MCIRDSPCELKAHPSKHLSHLELTDACDKITDCQGKGLVLRISIFGLGYVGAVSAGVLANEGHEVIGVDPVQTKVDIINRGQSPIIEAEIGDIIAASVRAKRLRATTVSYTHLT